MVTCLATSRAKRRSFDGDKRPFFCR